MSLGDNMLLMLLFFAGLTVCVVACVTATFWLQRRFDRMDVQAKADRFAVPTPAVSQAPGEPAVGQFKLTPPKIEASFGDNERIGRL